MPIAFSSLFFSLLLRYLSLSRPGSANHAVYSGLARWLQQTHDVDSRTVTESAGRWQQDYWTRLRAWYPSRYFIFIGMAGFHSIVSGRGLVPFPFLSSCQTLFAIVSPRRCNGSRMEAHGMVLSGSGSGTPFFLLPNQISEILFQRERKGTYFLPSLVQVWVWSVWSIDYAVTTDPKLTPSFFLPFFHGPRIRLKWFTLKYRNEKERNRKTQANRLYQWKSKLVSHTSPLPLTSMSIILVLTILDSWTDV